MDDSKVIKLFNGIKFVKGDKCSCLYDLDNSEILLLNLENNEEIVFNEFHNFIYSHEFLAEIEDQIVNSNYGFVSSLKELEKYIDPINNYFIPFQINTLYIEIDSEFDVVEFSKKLPNCINVIIHLKCFEKIDIAKLLENLNKNSKILNIEVITEYDKDIIYSFYSSSHNYKTSKIILYNANTTEQIIDPNLKQIQLIKTDRTISDPHKVQPSKEYHSINRISFCISQNYNLFYYKKIWMDGCGVLGFDNLNKFPKLGNYFYDNIKWDFIFEENHYPKELQIPKSQIRDCNSSIFRFCCNDPRIPEYDSLKNEYFYKNGSLCKLDI